MLHTTRLIAILLNSVLYADAVHIEEFTLEMEDEIHRLLKEEELPNLFNSYVSLICWLEERPLKVVRGESWMMLMSVGEDIELMRPLGVCDKLAMTKAVRFVRENFPDKDLWIYGLDDMNVELFEKKRLDDIQLSYVLDATAIAELTSKKLRNAVTKAQKDGLVAVELTKDNITQAKDLVARWAQREEGSSTSFKNHLLDEFIATGEYPGKGMLAMLNDEIVGLSYVVQDEVFPEYALFLVNISDKKINGISEFLLYTLSQTIAQWGCKYINYGGADPKDDPGLHTYKKKFGWSHILLEYGIKYAPEDSSPQLPE